MVPGIKVYVAHSDDDPIEVLDLTKHENFIDWRQKSVLSPVVKQGGCDSCYALSAVKF